MGPSHARYHNMHMVRQSIALPPSAISASPSLPISDSRATALTHKNNWLIESGTRCTPRIPRPSRRLPSLLPPTSLLATLIIRLSHLITSNLCSQLQPRDRTHCFWSGLVDYTAAAVSHSYMVGTGRFTHFMRTMALRVWAVLGPDTRYFG